MSSPPIAIKWHVHFTLNEIQHSNRVKMGLEGWTCKICFCFAIVLRVFQTNFNHSLFNVPYFLPRNFLMMMAQRKFFMYFHVFKFTNMSNPIYLH